MNNALLNMVLLAGVAVAAVLADLTYRRVARHKRARAIDSVPAAEQGSTASESRPVSA
jgi:hypothetical protein